VIVETDSGLWRLFSPPDRVSERSRPITVAREQGRVGAAPGVQRERSVVGARGIGDPSLDALAVVVRGVAERSLRCRGAVEHERERPDADAGLRAAGVLVGRRRLALAAALGILVALARD
jgi:hypothetical protein